MYRFFIINKCTIFACNKKPERTDFVEKDSMLRSSAAQAPTRACSISSSADGCHHRCPRRPAYRAYAFRFSSVCGQPSKALHMHGLAGRVLCAANNHLHGLHIHTDVRAQGLPPLAAREVSVPLHAGRLASPW